jgi:signal transduction histidine kinase
MMSGSLLIDWAAMAVSLFNTILTLWLGLTVLLNAERRSPGIWLAGGGLLLGAAFFFSHSAILGLGQMPYRADLWWQIGWIPVILAPSAWYVVMLWYAGFWEERPSSVYQRHRLWFWLVLLVNAGMLILFLVANPLPSLRQVLQFDFSASPSVLGTPILIALYPFYILVCIGLSLDALLRPGPTVRMMGQLARRRARPWLIAASITLLVVGLFVSGVLLWIMVSVQGANYDSRIPRMVGLADLLIATLIASAILLTGQAIVSYEVFTGKTLPRRGLKRYWQRAIILAAGYSLAVSLSLRLGLPSIYSLMLSTGLMVGFYALLSWRSYLERERFIGQLRPFITSQQLYERLLSTPEERVAPDIQGPFYALCRDVLGARTAVLTPLGSMAPLFGSPLNYPDQGALPLADISEIREAISGSTALCEPLQPEDNNGFAWAIPLWSARGLSGVLLLGEKVDQTLYTQEEIEIARAAGERLVDIQAGAEMAQRLMSLQRRQMVEGQVIDRQTRRILHDDVLPRLHTAMLTLSSLEAGSGQEYEQVLDTLAEVHSQIADLLRDMPAMTRSEVERLGLFSALQRVTQYELKGAFDRVSWQISPEARLKSAKLPPLTAEVLFYAVRETMRNAARHARPTQESAPLHLHIAVDWGEGLEIIIEDNGVGIEDASGGQSEGGQGLALHSTMLAIVGGSLSVESTPGVSTMVRIELRPQGRLDP